MERNYLERNVIIYLYQNGAMVFKRKKDKSTKFEGALPVFSVDTVEEAEEMQTALCRLSRADNETYILPFSGQLDDLYKAQEMMHNFYDARKRGLPGEVAWNAFENYKKATGVL